ncbi:MAG: universal stress protein [Syntrophorhabdales bacterium]|jgi:nucleotide-binding universal stress UspA family protein
MILEIKKILYATDLSKNASYAFFYAANMAEKHNARIVMLHAIKPGPYTPYEAYGLAAVMGLQKQEQEMDFEEMRTSLQNFCKRMETHVGHPCSELVSKILVPLGHPVEEILKAADDEGCDAIVLGTHGKGFLRQTFLGSVAGSVLERARKPVFVIPLPSEKTNIDWDKIMPAMTHKGGM